MDEGRVHVDPFNGAAVLEDLDGRCYRVTRRMNRLRHEGAVMWVMDDVGIGWFQLTGQGRERR